MLYIFCQNKVIYEFVNIFLHRFEFLSMLLGLSGKNINTTRKPNKAENNGNKTI